MQGSRERGSRLGGLIEGRARGIEKDSRVGDFLLRRKAAGSTGYNLGRLRELSMKAKPSMDPKLTIILKVGCYIKTIEYIIGLS
jgi:hypothetical protein